LETADIKSFKKCYRIKYFSCGAKCCKLTREQSGRLRMSDMRFCRVDTEYRIRDHEGSEDVREELKITDITNSMEQSPS
jgi:hypothetical protein